MDIEINHQPDHDRFEAEVDHQSCVLEYQLEQGVMAMNRVYVPKPVEGRGIASKLTRYALDHCRSEGLKVVPRCPYVATWIKRHDDYADLVVPVD